MKIKVVSSKIDEVMHMPGYEHKDPARQRPFFRWLLKTLSEGALKKVNFSYEKAENVENIPADQPCLFLMNHSSFIDLEIASKVLYPREFHIICTADGFVGKEKLMRGIGCIPTFKFISDPVLVKDMLYTVRKLNASILMYPEASYSFDGTATPLPDSLGKLLKLLKVPVVMIRTYGAFHRDPLYNNLQLRKVNVSATMRCLLTPEEIREKSADELNAVLKEVFTFDSWKWQEENNIRITEPFRADGLHRVLYKCPRCGAEGKMAGEGIFLTCGNCGIRYELDELGRMVTQGDPELRRIPEWYAWERSCVRTEIQKGTYRMELPVDICVMVNTQAVYRVGEGALLHTSEGFHLTGCDGKIDYHQSAKSSYSLYSDYYWYEIGDMICIGTSKIQYYCFPKEKGANVAKARLAAEESYQYSTGHS
ncbi:MAG: 1-acyl-sn-glycerol-3-phosphate acyltransferase [Lachnospiraceae bacterium]|nr:1-acyl-sn-glycerol-3-phosphate acyltransferase [Lachnospiraceae bacterium]